ncbi:coproporphyrinogen III oxidase [Fusobacterium animalis D11]|uniref:Coproporphyrinogen III oxidase n=1 Tax=Fusobacterium animalis D11 TaxID=556264 RepID=D6BEA8_9FUSO|nr:coproporphyrinogen III oxidase [Fusobacterium animalis D11]
MLIHDFGIVGEKKDVHLHDDLILYMIDTFEWIKTFSELESNIEKKWSKSFRNNLFQR